MLKNRSPHNNNMQKIVKGIWKDSLEMYDNFGDNNLEESNTKNFKSWMPLLFLFFSLHLPHG